MRQHSVGLKVVFVLPYPPPQDFRRKFFVEQLIGKGLETEYWNVGPALGHPGNVAYDGAHGGLQYVAIRRLRELAVRLKQEDHRRTIFVPQITRAIDSFPLYFLLSRSGCKTVMLARGYLPSIARADRTLRYYLRLLQHKDEIKLRVWFATFLLLTRLVRLKKYDIVFVAGRIAEQINLPDAVRLSRIHHQDVDAALADEPSAVEVPEDYCVFIDDYLPHHPDFCITGSPTVDAAKYYVALNRFFDRIEQRLGTAVVVAAHPRAVYAANPFEGRLVVAGETNALVKNARIAFAHMSTAVSFAVLHRKKLCLIHSADIRRVHPIGYLQMLKTAEILGCPLLDFETWPGDELPVQELEVARYEQYRVEFLSHDVRGLSSFDVVATELMDLLTPTGPEGTLGIAGHPASSQFTRLRS